MVHRSPVYVHCLVLLKLYLSMGMRGNPEGRLASKVALLCCAFLFIFSVLSLTAGNSSSRDRSGEQTLSCDLMLYLFFLSEFLTLLMAFAAAEITSWRTKFDPQVSSSLKPSRSQVEDKWQSGFWFLIWLHQMVLRTRRCILAKLSLAKMRRSGPVDEERWAPPY